MNPQPRLCVVVLPALPESVPLLRRIVRYEAARWLLPEDAGEALQLVVSELAGNVVLHSGSPYVALFVRVDEDALTVKVRDGGSWEGGSGGGAREDGECCGRGLDLVGAVASRFTLVRGSCGTEAVAELDLGPSGPVSPAVPKRRASEEHLALSISV
ncbi:ATP-binding protein [Streptomyces hydrogenans]|uniref:ATP-binding protein n=1 Tax=Streptomyces hydrogenans TaxID=1873719 RepID=UPI0035DDA5A6